MKGRFLSLFLILTLLTAFMSSCKDTTPKGEFTHCELTLVLDETFSEEETEDFDILLRSGEIAVSLIRISFDAAVKEGIGETYTAKGFAAFFMHKSEKSTELLMHGDVPYYNYTETVSGADVFYTVTFYRSLSAYFIVAYATPDKNKDLYKDKFLIYADNAYFNDAPEIITK